VSFLEEFLGKLLLESGISPDHLIGEVTVPDSVNFRVRDVMVGVLRNAAQYRINYDHHFYHIPAKNISKKNFPIRFIALYQSSNFFTSVNSGVRVYGEVAECTLLRRSMIKEIPCKGNPEELYYRFDMKRWIHLKEPVQTKEFGPDVNTFTNLFLLENCSCLPELYIQTKDEFIYYFTLKRICARLGSEKEKFHSSYICEGIRTEISGGIVRICPENGKELELPIKDLRTKPRLLLDYIQNIFSYIVNFIS
jgi:hypothetical protein